MFEWGMAHMAMLVMGCKDMNHCIYNQRPWCCLVFVLLIIIGGVSLSEGTYITFRNTASIEYHTGRISHVKPKKFIEHFHAKLPDGDICSTITRYLTIEIYQYIRGVNKT